MYKRIDNEFNARLAARADELNRARMNRPYSSNLTQQMAHLVEDQELAAIRIQQVKARLPKPAPKSQVWEAIMIILVLAVIAFILLYVGLSIGGIFGTLIAIPGCMIVACIFCGGLN